jgi:signal transduction histidine kinase
LARIRAASRVPVFGSFDDQLGLGIVGGRLIQIGRVGSELARAAEAMLRGALPPDPLKIIAMSEPIYDWRELQAWDIDVDRLPPGSAIRFQQPPPWKQYWGWFLLAALVVAAQALLVTALLLQRRRRRQAEQASANLASRLITAHEDEHRRIARELHDDLSQRLARLSIDASYLTSNPGSEAAVALLRNMQPELARLGKDIHDMSYRLHPSVVDDLGIAAALRTECERARRRTDAAIVENINEIRERVPHDTALGVYRIAQEALHNAIRHAAAETIEIALGCDGRTLTLAVQDDGKGFATGTDAAGRGIGLSSMRERARLAQGMLKISSRPGRGTSVIAEVPLRDAAT